MQPLKLDLDGADRSWLENRVSEGGYASLSDLIADLIRREQARLEREAINQRLRAAVNSGPSSPVTKESWKARYGELEGDRRPEKRAG